MSDTQGCLRKEVVCLEALGSYQHHMLSGRLLQYLRLWVLIDYRSRQLGLDG